MRSGGKVGQMARGVLDHPWYIVLLIGTVALGYWVVGTRTTKHHINASFSSAFNFVPGLDVQVLGRDVGKVGKVTYVDGRANVQLGIDDDSYWPLHEGTRVVQRYGTTIGSGTRKLDLLPGPAGGKELKENSVIPVQDTTPAVDVDQIFNIFTKKRRANVQQLVGRLEKSLDGGQDLNDAVRTAGPGVRAATDFLSQLGADGVALNSLIRNTRRTMGSLEGRKADVSGVITATAATFDEFARNTQGMEQALVEAPSTFREARTTLARLDSSVGNLDGLVTDLRDGAKQLKPLASAATPALSQLRATIPSAVNTVRATTTAAPPVTNLLKVGEPFTRQLQPAAERLAPMIACIRPYAPEGMNALIGLSGWTQNYEVHNRDTNYYKLRNLPPRYGVLRGTNKPGTAAMHSLRAQPIIPTTRTAHIVPQALSSELFAKLSGQNYAFPRPPGLASGNPQFQPECGVGPESLDPSKDPEQGITTAQGDGFPAPTVSGGSEATP